MKYILKLTLILLAVFFATRVANAQGITVVNDLSVGVSNPEVALLQTWLISNGYDIPAISSGAASKGYFGMQTKAAVMRMQAANGIPNTGYVGPLTRGRLNGNSPQSFSVVSPNGGEQLVKNTTYSINWTGSPGILHQSGTLMLVPRPPACLEPVNGGPRCMIAVRAPYYINGINLDARSYSWRVGDHIVPTDSGPDSPISDGEYKIQICSNDSSICDTSDNYFSIVTSNTTNKSPVINGIQAPTTLKVNELGTWRVNALDPQNGTLTYYVNWGDIVAPVFSCPQGYVCQPSAALSVTQQGSTFSHTYSQPGTYNVNFTVTNSAGLTANSSITVTVTGTASNKPRVTSPNGGESWVANGNSVISWDVNGTTISKVDIYLDEVKCPMSGTFCTASLPLSYVLDKNIDASHAYGWITATDIADRHISPGTWRVRVCEAGSTTNCDSSDQFFTITN